MATKKEKDINNRFGKIVRYKSPVSGKTFIAKINSKVDSETKIVGLDLMDGFPFNFLAHIEDIRFTTNNRLLTP